MVGRHCRWLVGGCLSVAALGAVAGGGPETTLLVVNARSPLSVAVANEFRRVRDLPARQVLWLEGVPVRETIDLETFRQRILAPIRAHLAATGLAEEVDLIAYSAGFPYAVDLRSDLRAHNLAGDRYRGDAASLTGLTFFAGEVADGGVGYLGRQANPYFRRPLRRVDGALPGASAEGAQRVGAPLVFEPSRGFRQRQDWGRGSSGGPNSGAGRHFLAVMLGYTGLRGNSLPEIAAYLGRGAASDGTRPDGTVYLMENQDIRTKARRPLFPATIDALAARGRRGVILVKGQEGQNGLVPVGKTDIIGLVAGTRYIHWEPARSRFLPGAIAESLTSYGGHFAWGAQSKLTEFLRHGAAGASGAVREPYAIVEKFPLPQMHVYYADGSSLAEAFYQSVAAPYQLIIVGDPLARPFARFASIALAAAPAEGVWRGVVEVSARVAGAPGRGVERVELWLDGGRVGQGPPGKAIALDTTRLADGEHELRLVAVEAGPIGTRSYGSYRISVDNRGRRVEVLEAPATAALGEPVQLAGRAPGAQWVAVREGGRQLARVPVREGRWALRLDPARLGLGTVQLQAVAEYPDGGRAQGAPQALRIEAGPLIAPGAAPPAEQRGLEAVLEGLPGGPVRTVVDGLSGRLPRELRGARPTRMVVSGAFEVRQPGLHELTVEAAGELSLAVGEAWRHGARIAPEDGGLRLALPLAAGWHRFELRLDRPGGNLPRVLLAGPEPAFVLEGDRVRRP